MQLSVVDNVSALQKALTEVARAGRRVALVPTMGALHAGHMALVEAARKQADFVVVSIFVNPIQFAVGEDFDKYPRMLEADIKKLAEAGVSLVYAPSREDMYPAGFAAVVSPGPMGDVLCGKFRRGHFDGVATVVTKLLLRILPHVALFGEKDYQQLCVIRKVVYDLDIPMEIIGVPTVRESDGLAMSSRNAYLSAEERKLAPILYQTLKETAAQILAKPDDVSGALVVSGLKLSQAGFKVDYLELCAADSLDKLTRYEKPCRLMVAAHLGKTRLIDNIAVE